MSKNETIDKDKSEISTDNLDSNFGPTGRTKDILKKPIHVKGRQTWRGQPSPKSSQDKIGEDGKEQKYSCQIVEEFDTVIKQEETKASSFYITEMMYNQLDKLVSDDKSIDILFQEGKHTGTLYVVKRKNMKPGGMDYWSFVNEKQLKEVELA